MYYAIESIAVLQICYVINTLPCVLHFGFEIQQNVNTGNDRAKNPSDKKVKFRKWLARVKDDILFRLTQKEFSSNKERIVTQNSLL